MILPLLRVLALAVVVLVVVSLGRGTARAASKRPTIYPFDVRVGGQLAVVEGNPDTAIFAKLKDPVPPDAEVEVEGQPGMLILNVFPVNPDGTVDSSAPVKAIFASGATKVRLSQTMDGSKLEPGLWGMNVVFASATSRVMFWVGGAKPAGTPVDGSSKVTAP